jgi:hypothetical protein
LLIGMARLYPWVTAPPSGFRGAWLTPFGFGLRGVLWFAILFAANRSRSTIGAVLGLIALVLLGTLVAIDWAMSLDPDFHSSGFGLQALGMAFTLALAVAMLRTGDFANGVPGALLLTLLMLWCYFAYLQFLILWSGNFPPSAAWYLVRASGTWSVVESAAVALHAAPLLALLSPAIRRSALWLPRLALAVIAGELLHAAWLILPAVGAVTLASGFAALAAFAIVGAAMLSPWRTAR